MTIDGEMLYEAHAALRKSFSKELQALVNRYAKLARDLSNSSVICGGLPVRTWPDSSPFTRASLYVDWPAPGIFGPDHRGSAGCHTLMEAFEHEKGLRILLEGEVIFTRDTPQGEWRRA